MIKERSLLMDIRKLDYSLKAADDRKKLVEQIIAETPPNQLTDNYIEILRISQ